MILSSSEACTCVGEQSELLIMAVYYTKAPCCEPKVKGGHLALSRVTFGNFLLSNTTRAFDGDTKLSQLALCSAT